MKKISNRIAALTKEAAAKNAVLANMRKGLSNSLSDEAVAEAQAVIAEKQAEIDAINAAIEELKAADEDKDEELRAQLAELQAKTDELAENMKKPQSVLKLNNYIKSKKAIKDFTETVRNARDGKAFKAAWKGVLAQNGITTDGESNEFILPEAVLAEINDAWEDTANNFLELLDVTGLLALKTVYEDAGDRAHGHQKGSDKKEQSLNFVSKEIRAQVVYKYIRIDRETVEYEDATGALMQYIARELAYRILHEIMRAVLVGDGRDDSAEDKISKIEAVVDAGDPYITISASSAAAPSISDVVDALASIKANGAIVMFTTKSILNSLRKFYYTADGTPVYNSIANLAETLGVSEIRTSDVLEGSGYDMIAFVGKAYKVVGDLSMKGFTDFVLSSNKNEYLNEVYVGGALAVPFSACALTSYAG